MTQVRKYFLLPWVKRICTLHKYLGFQTILNNSILILMKKGLVTKQEKVISSDILRGPKDLKKKNLQPSFEFTL